MDPQFNVIEIRFSLQLTGSPAFVWDALVNRIEKWWKPDFYSSEKTRSMRLEPWLGGRLYEDFGDREGVIWAHVAMIEQPSRLLLKGFLAPDWGGPAENFISISLFDRDGSTAFHFSDTTMGFVSETTKISLEKGWRRIFEDSFSSFIEGQKETT